MSKEKVKRKTDILIKIKKCYDDDFIEDYYELEEDLEELEKPKIKKKSREYED